MAESAGIAAIDDMISRLRGFPESIRAEAPGLAKAVQRELEADIAAGRAPDGSTWPLRKGGGKALANAAAKLTGAAIGTVLLFTLRGAEVWHNFGTRHVPKRQILPSSGLPTNLAVAIKKGVVEVFKSKVGGRRG